MDFFQYQQRIEVCLLAEMNLRSSEAFLVPKYIYHTDWLAKGIGTVIMVRRFIDHYNVPVQILST